MPTLGTSSSCNMACPGDSSSTCGGANGITLFKNTSSSGKATSKSTVKAMTSILAFIFVFVPFWIYELFF